MKENVKDFQMKKDFISPNDKKGKLLLNSGGLSQSIVLERQELEGFNEIQISNSKKI